MQIDVPSFIFNLMIARNGDPDAAGADRIALVASALNLGQVPSALLTKVLVDNQTPPPATGTGETPSARHRAPGMPVKVPPVHHLTAADQIEEHLQRHKLRARIDRESLPEIKAPRVLRQSPPPDTVVMEGAEVHVLMLVPEDGKPEPEVRTRR